MVAPRDFLSQLAGGTAATPSVNLRGALDAIRAEYGKGARAYLAALTGASRDTAGRWLSGKQTPSTAVAGRVERIRDTGQGIVARAKAKADRERQAEKIRKMRTITPRLVAVSNTSGKSPTPDGRRQIVQPITLGPVSDQIADAWARGDEDRAAELFSNAVISGYAGESVGSSSGLASLIQVNSFEATPHVTFND